jgi:hypothetical protein
MYYENDSDETDTIIMYDSDDTHSESDTIPYYSEELQIHEEDIEFIQNEATQAAFDDISQEIDNQHIGHERMQIGTYKYIRRSRQFLHIMNIPLVSFFKYNSYLISRYFYWHSSFYVAEHPPVELIQIYEVGNPLTVSYCVIKTFWIKIIQRVWRRVYNERQRIIQGRKTIESIRYRELNGHFPEGYRVMPRFSLNIRN